MSHYELYQSGDFYDELQGVPFGADTRPAGDYRDFASVDLSGFTFSVGVTFRR